MMATQLRHIDYTIGWICVLPIELAAASKLLEEEHQNLSQPHTDSNTYILGRIADHNVVLACGPEPLIPSTSAAAVAANLLLTFPGIRFALLVGVGSGVPTLQTDIRLGDVVIGTAGRDHGAVVQYHLERTAAGESVQHTGALNVLSNNLLGAMTRLRADQASGQGDFQELLKKASDLVGSSETRRDILFSPAYGHVGESSCDLCDGAYHVIRTSRPNKNPVIHYGLIASGKSVPNEAIARDRLASEIGGVMCFETEAVGMSNAFPCIVIRGIADYGDSHKNRLWLSYAVVMVASYAAWLLEYIPPA
ncbi:hypothetical protein NUW58_g3366 [Xylaria curta]|uniref:Uncharacterized protein n=1 Tax=Xylaria curta TaxID=42375 RepID=A0ACC1PB99_9PEZI|nr:hypothetical protein NUW58_g3366 [Xylaria curta]